MNDERLIGLLDSDSGQFAKRIVSMIKANNLYEIIDNIKFEIEVS